MEAIKTPAGILWTGQVVPALCLDLDGTIRRSKSGKEFIEGPDDIELYPDVEAKLWEYREKGYVLFGLSNQGGVAHGFKTVEQAEAELEATCALFQNDPIHFIQQAYHMEGGSVFPYNYRSLFRKPNVGMLVMLEVEAWDHNMLVDWNNSLLIGDRPEDQECASRAGIAFQWASDFFGRDDTSK